MTRTWTAEQISPRCIRLLCNGTHLASLNHKDDCGGNGWVVIPMSPNYPRSRKYWATPETAIGTYGKDAVAAVKALQQQAA